MKKRVTVLLAADTYGRLARRARRRGHTVSEEIREAVDRLLEEEHPNQAWLDFAREVEAMPLGPDRGPLPPVDSDEAREEAARGIYRDPVRSSREHFVKTSGLRWISIHLLTPIPWIGRVWALPFFTVLAASDT